jgi:uncharacterized protein YbdZ (MbtH family)
MKVIYRCIFFLVFLVQVAIYGQQNLLRIPLTSAAPTVDGILDEGEWKDAAEIQLQRTDDWQIHVFAMYDEDYLYIAFSNLHNPAATDLNAEVLLQNGSGTGEWDANTYWFHSSYGNCSAQGNYYIWENCSKDPIGWRANTFPFKNGNDNIEFKIRRSHIQLASLETGTSLKASFKLSSANELHSYWPKEATIKDPKTWGLLHFK